MDIGNAFMLASAERVGADNVNRMSLFDRQLSRLNASTVPVLGKYHGTEEHSRLVWTEEGSELADSVERLAFRVYDQESVLYVDCNRFCELVFRDGRRVPLGRWQELRGDADDWTETPDGRRWIAAA